MGEDGKIFKDRCKANAIAIRIARAYNKKNKLLFVDITAGRIGTCLQIIEKKSHGRHLFPN